MPGYALAAGVAVAATLLRVLVSGAIGESGLYVTVFPAVMLCGAFLGLGPALLAAMIGVVGIEYSFGTAPAGYAGIGIRTLLVFSSAATVAWLGSATRALRAMPAPVLVAVPQAPAAPAAPPAPEPQPQIALDDAVAIAESAKRAKERFLGQVSHELRTPLVQAMVALDAMPSGAQHEELLGHLRRELRLVDDLLDMTRLTSAKLPVYPRPIGLHEVLQEAGRSCSEQLRSRGQKLAYELKADKDLMNGDPARLAQAIAAVLSNAAKFSPEKSSIRLTTASVGKKIRLTIEDEGSGIQPAVLAQVFDAFEQGEADRFGGLGLGLSIARGLVLLHGGSIKIHGRDDGKGTRVEIVLPLLEKLPEEPTLFA